MERITVFVTVVVHRFFFDLVLNLLMLACASLC